MSRTAGSKNGVRNDPKPVNGLDPITGKRLRGRPRNDPSTTIDEQRALASARHNAMDTTQRGKVFSGNLRGTFNLYYAMHDESAPLARTDTIAQANGGYETLIVNHRGRLLGMVTDAGQMAAFNDMGIVVSDDDATLAFLDADAEEFGGFGEPLRLDRQYWMETNI